MVNSVFGAQLFANAVIPAQTRTLPPAALPLINEPPKFQLNSTAFDLFKLGSLALKLISVRIL